MRFALSNPEATGARPRRAAFTLVEVLAALAFMAIVIPAAIEGLRIANLAGQVGQRKNAAARVAARVMDEWIANSQTRGTTRRGVVMEDAFEYRWSLRTEPWTLDTLTLVTAEVLYTVQGRDYDVRLSTLVDVSTR